MSYPTEVVMQPLYEASTTRRHPLGTEYTFDVSGTKVKARYVQNVATASVAAGTPAVYDGLGPGRVSGSFAASTPIWDLAGGLAASLAANSYGWAIFHGPQTNALGLTTAASSAATRNIEAGAAGFVIGAATYAATNGQQVRVVAKFGTSAAWATTAANTIYWQWR